LAASLVREEEGTDTDASPKYLMIGNRKTIMLALMFGPGINLEGLKVGVRSFCVDEDSPTPRGRRAAFTTPAPL
jgi:hypothetical protein